MATRLYSRRAMHQTPGPTLPQKVMQQPRIEFEPVDRTHFGLLRQWLEEPHWREWWGDPETEISYIIDMVEGRDTTKPFIFNVDGAPAGYIQQWFIGHHHCEPWITDHPCLIMRYKQTKSETN